MKKSELIAFEKNAIKLQPPGKEYQQNERWEIPFTILDKTPGGENCGRITWCIEIITGNKRSGGWATAKSKRRFIEKLYIWALQTRDKRVAKKTFTIDVFAESIRGNILGGRHTQIEPCSEHKNGTIIFTSPENTPDNEGALIIKNTTSVSLDINFNS